MSAPHVYLALTEAEEGFGFLATGVRHLGAVMYVLGVEPWSFGRGVSAFNWAISSALEVLGLFVCLSFCFCFFTKYYVLYNYILCICIWVWVGASKYSRCLWEPEVVGSPWVWSWRWLWGVTWVQGLSLGPLQLLLTTEPSPDESFWSVTTNSVSFWPFVFLLHSKAFWYNLRPSPRLG